MSEPASEAEVPMVLTADGHEPEPGLLPLMVSDVPLNLYERVAFHEDHEDHPGMYGRILAIGYQDGYVKLDVAVIDPQTGQPDDPPVIKRINLRGDIQ